jgi:prolyl-tRNA synthetase
MLVSNLFVPTRRDDPAGAEVVSHKLLVRAGYMKMLARGIYTFLPLGRRVMRKIETIIREEMDRAGAQEILMPAVQPAELWKESGRWDFYGPELLRFKDRKGSDFCFGPTHEEVITDLVRGDVRSYKQLPINLYQIQSKFRDEIRPRAGLMRGREFVMKDAYSFDVSPEAAAVSYEKMRTAYVAICERMGFEFRAVEADTGNIGGSLSHEFQVLAQSGEDLMVACDHCDYAANVEKAELSASTSDDERIAVGTMTRVDTPGTRTVAQVTELLDVKATDLVKTIVFLADAEPVAVLVRGDYEANEVKVKAFTGAKEILFAGEATVHQVTGAPVGFAGPVGLACRVLADHSVAGMTDFVCGGNEKDVHLKDVNFTDFEVEAFADLRKAGDGDACPRCDDGKLRTYRGIEVGHIFYLGTKYSEAMGLTFQDESSKVKHVEMGCYGIGVTRMMAAVIEQNHDDNGICWPMPMAPYQVWILTLGRQTDELVAAGQKLHDDLQALGIEVVLDDRNDKPGAKFKDADLVGVPIRLAIGARGLKEGKVELKWRHEKDYSNVDLDTAAEHVAGLVRAAMS